MKPADLRLRAPALPLAAQGSETRAHFFREDLRLFPGGKMTAFGNFVEVDELGIRLLRPAPRRLVELVGEHAYRRRDVDAFGSYVIERVLPVDATGGDARICQPEVGAVVENVVGRQAFRHAVKGPRNHFETARVVVE